MKLKSWHPPALISIVVLLAYYPALFAPLNPIDDNRMVDDLLNRSGIPWRDFLFPVSKSYYRPLVGSSFLLDRYLWNLETPFLHFGNMMLHWVNTLLVFALACRIGRLAGLTGVGLAVCAALLFGLHPVNTEAVIWVSGRADLMAGFFILLILHGAISFYTSQKKSWLLTVAGLFFLGCLAKETVLFVWPGLIAAGWLVSRDFAANPNNRLLRLVPALLPAFASLFSIAGYFALRAYALHGRDLGIGHVGKVLAGTPSSTVASTASSSGEFLVAGLEKALTVLGFYFRKMVQPFPLNFGITGVPEYYLWGGVLLILCCLYWLVKTSWPGVLLLTAVSLTSVAVLVAFGGISWTPVAERYLYSPSAMAAIGVSVAGAGYLKGKPPRPWPFLAGSVVALLLVIAAVGTFSRALVWQDNVALFRDTVDKSPDFAMARVSLATVLMQRGDRDEAAEMMRDLDIPAFQVASLNKVSIMVADGKFEEARAFLIGRLQNPGAYRRIVLENLVRVLALMADGEPDAARKKIYQTEQLTHLNDLWKSTREPFYLYQVGRLQLSMGDRSSARHAFETAYQAFPEGSIYREPSRKLAESMKSP